MRGDETPTFTLSPISLRDLSGCLGGVLKRIREVLTQRSSEAVKKRLAGESACPTNVGQTLSSVNPAISAIVSRLGERLPPLNREIPKGVRTHLGGHTSKMWFAGESACLLLR